MTDRKIITTDAIRVLVRLDDVERFRSGGVELTNLQVTFDDGVPSYSGHGRLVKQDGTVGSAGRNVYFLRAKDVPAAVREQVAAAYASAVAAIPATLREA